jgi:cell division protein FtsB
MTEAIWVALITVVLGGGSGYGGSLLLKRLNKNHDKAVVDDLVTARLSKELDRVYKRVDDLEKDVESLREDRDMADARAENAEQDARSARRQAQDAQVIAADFLAHITKLEALVPPPPPKRPWAET